VKNVTSAYESLYFLYRQILIINKPYIQSILTISELDIFHISHCITTVNLIFTTSPWITQGMYMNLSTQPWTGRCIIMFSQSIGHILECSLRNFQTTWVQFILSTNFESHPHDIQRTSLTAAASFLCFTCQSGPAPSLARLSILPSFHLGGGCLSINHPSMWKDRKKREKERR
jgi:hypothetical protein